MSKSKESFNKKEKEKKRLQKKQQKEFKKQERMSNSDKGKTLDEMYAYVDEFGNLTSVPPQERALRNNNNLVLTRGERTKGQESKTRTGIVTFFNVSKGFGFIKDAQTNEKIFMHISSLAEPVEEEMEVSFTVQQSARGLVASTVKPVNQ